MAVLRLIFFLVLCGFASIHPLKTEERYLFIIVADGFKADYLNRNITPNLDRMIDEGVFANSLQGVFPTTAYTNNVSLFTGCVPENHGITANVFINPQTNEYFDSRNPEIYNDPKWYNAEFIWERAEKYGILSSMVCIPGSSIESNYMASYYFLDADSKALPEYRIEEAINRLSYEKAHRPRLTGIYFNDVDDAGHNYGTISDQTNQAIQNIDNYVGTIIDSLISLDIYDDTDIMFVSTYGMIDVGTFNTVNIKEILFDFDGGINIINNGAFCFIYCKDDSTNNIKALQKEISEKTNSLYVYTKDEIPDSLRFKHHPFIPDILLIAKEGNIIVEKNDFRTYGLKAMHGYLPFSKDMKGLLIASGPDFKNGYKTEEIQIIDIYPMLCKLLSINIPKHIDGKLENIKQILK